MSPHAAMVAVKCFCLGGATATAAVCGNRNLYGRTVYTNSELLRNASRYMIFP